MIGLSKGRLEKLTWKQVRKDVAKVNPEFAKVIDELSPGDDHWIAKVTYPYGSLVMKRSLLMLPNAKGDLVPITDSSLDSAIREGLIYNLQSNPVSLVLKNSFEIFLPLEDRTIPLSGPICPGTAFGAWRILNLHKTQHPAFIWDMTAGARSVFMLPKIAETKKHMHLKRAYSLTADTPRTLMDHWGIFRQLANHPNFEQPWEAEILFFPIQWFSHLNDFKWQPFYYHFQNSAWGVTELWRNQFIWNVIFSLILYGYEARPNAYITDTVKYLIYAGVRAFPAFSPARSNLGGPFKEIQKIYQEEYGLKTYPPVILQPDMFDMYNPASHPIYYSLQFPNASEFRPSSRSRANIISDLHEIRSLMIRYERELLSDRFNIKDTALYDVFRHTQYDYFHSGVDLHLGMRHSSEMAAEDKGLLTTVDGKVHENFPETASFLKGCIRISRKK